MLLYLDLDEATAVLVSECKGVAASRGSGLEAQE